MSNCGMWATDSQEGRTCKLPHRFVEAHQEGKPNMSGRRKLVYVGCRANLNRSFILEQILLNLIKEASLPIDIKSGGVMVDERVSNMAYYPTDVIEFDLA